jgi:photosystem II stability/assembly factor-like uncharacterized protein
VSWRRATEVEAQVTPGANPSDSFGKRPELSWVTQFEWFDTRVGVILGYGKPVAFRTEDAGATWTRVPLPDDQWFYDSARAGSHVWACGSSGKLLHSADFGRTWSFVSGVALAKSRPEPPGGVTPFGNEERCMSIEFASESVGWVAGAISLWKTEDAGKTWRTLQVPPFTAEEKTGFAIRELFVESPETLWLSGDAGRFVTRDGGKSWKRVTLRDTAGRSVPTIAAVGPNRTEVLVAVDSDGHGVPLLVSDVARWGTSGLVQAGRDLRYPQQR